MEQLQIPFGLFGKIISSFWEDYEKKLFKPTLDRSDRIHLEDRYSDFIQITEQVEINLLLEDVFSNEKRPFSQLVLNNTGEQEINSLDISVRTNLSCGGECVDRFQISNLRPNKLRDIQKIRFINLVNIPLVEMRSDEQSGEVYRSHGNLDVKIHSIKVGNIVTENPEQEYISHISNHFCLLLQNKWVKKWDFTYNIGWIILAQEKLYIKLHYDDNVLPKLLVKNKHIITLIIRFWFWILIFRGKQFDRDGYLIAE